MKKFSCTAVRDASKWLGNFEAETKEEAVERVEVSAEATILCPQCAGEIDLGDVIKIIVEELPEEEKEV